jgi:hypothetical protein
MMRRTMKWSYGVVVWLVLASGCSGGESGPTTAEWMRKGGWAGGRCAGRRRPGRSGIYNITDKGCNFSYDVETRRWRLSECG